MISKPQTKRISSTPRPQTKRTSSKLKSQILAEILSPNASIPIIAKQYNISSTTLYGWRSNHIKKNISGSNANNNQEIPKSNNNFIELLTEKELAVKSTQVNPDTIADESTKSKSLSEISLIFNKNISLSLKGNISPLALAKILDIFTQEESC